MTTTSDLGKLEFPVELVRMLNNINGGHTSLVWTARTRTESSVFVLTWTSEATIKAKTQAKKQKKQNTNKGKTLKRKNRADLPVRSTKAKLKTTDREDSKPDPPASPTAVVVVPPVKKHKRLGRYNRDQGRWEEWKKRVIQKHGDKESKKRPEPPAESGAPDSPPSAPASGEAVASSSSSSTAPAVSAPWSMSSPPSRGHPDYMNYVRQWFEEDAIRARTKSGAPKSAPVTNSDVMSKLSTAGFDPDPSTNEELETPGLAEPGDMEQPQSDDDNMETEEVPSIPYRALQSTKKRSNGVRHGDVLLHTNSNTQNEWSLSIYSPEFGIYGTGTIGESGRECWTTTRVNADGYEVPEQYSYKEFKHLVYKDQGRTTNATESTEKKILGAYSCLKGMLHDFLWKPPKG
jgi:hypothetical protein